MHEVTITITVQTDVDTSKVYPKHMTEASQAVQTVKDKITSVFGPSATFENSYVTPENEFAFKILTVEHLENFCQPGKGLTTCAYLTLGPNGYTCCKGTPTEFIIKQHISTWMHGDYCNGLAGSLPISTYLEKKYKL